MRLTEAQSRALLYKHGVYITEACDKCGKILGHVRFTRYGEAGEWCSRLYYDGAPVAERRIAERRQNAMPQQAFRQRLRVTENPPVSNSFRVR